MKTCFIIFILLLLPLSDVYATIYKYVDEDGVIHLTNVPTEVRYKPAIREKTDTISVKSTKEKQCDPIIEALGKKYSVDPALIRAIIKAESDFNPKALSNKGATGIMQLTKGTAKELKVNNLYNIQDNIEGGVKYIKYLLDLFDDDVIFAVAAYNAGENAVKKYNSIPPYPETQNYVRRVLGYYKTFSE